MALIEFRKIEKCSLFLKSVKDDLIKKGNDFITWVSHSTKHNAIAVKASQQVFRITDNKFALVFKENLYQVHGITLSPIDDHSYAVVIITYKTNNPEEQFLISDYSKKMKSLEEYLLAQMKFGYMVLKMEI